MIDDGLVRLEVEEVTAGKASCTVVVGGQVEPYKGVNVPGVSIPVTSLTEKDVHDLDFALELGVDFVALSFVRSSTTSGIARANSLGRRTGEHHRQDREGRSAVGHERDHRGLRRGDGRPGRPRCRDRAGAGPARAEADHPLGTGARQARDHRDSDARVHARPPRANASGSLGCCERRPRRDRCRDAVGRDGNRALSGRERARDRPDHARRRARPRVPPRVSRTAEQPFPTVRDAVTNAACDIAEVLSAKAIVVPTFSGKTASGVARHRPRRPIVAASHRPEALRQMAIEWGVIPCEIEEGRDVEDIWARALEAARTCGVVLPGDRVVITAGSAISLPGTTNLIKVETA